MRAPVGALGGGGALSSKAPREVWTERTRSLPGGERPRGPRRRVVAAGSEIGAYLGDAGSGDPAFRVTDRFTAAFREPLGILRGWLPGRLGGANL